MLPSDHHFYFSKFVTKFSFLSLQILCRHHHLRGYLDKQRTAWRITAEQRHELRVFGYPEQSGHAQQHQWFLKPLHTHWLKSFKSMCDITKAGAGLES